MSHLKENLVLLSRRQPELADILASLPGKGVEVFPSASGMLSARYLQGSSATALHSRYDPLKEARQSASKHDLSGADYLVLLGFGLGYLLDALLEKGSDPANHYFIIESDLRILRAAFEARDMGAVLSLPHLHFAWPPSGPELAEQWKRFFDPVQAQKNVFVSHGPSLAVAPDLFRAAAEIIQSETFQIFTDINTLVGRSQVFLDNFVQNLRYALESPGITSFAGRFAGTPAILVSAGPSLDKNIQDLRGWEERALILATDTSLKPLLAAGIEPHFIVTGDPSYANFLHLKGAAAHRSLLVAEATAYPETFREFAGHTITCIYENSSLRSLSQLLAEKGTLRAWGSVATMALDFALTLGCNPVIFIGQDLAHSDGRTYCSGLYMENEWFPGSIGPAEWRQKWEALRSRKKVIPMKDVFGQPVETTDKLAAYWNWIIKEIRHHPEIRFVNATEGGILSEGVDVVSLREALHRYARENRQLYRRVKSIYENAVEKQAPQKNDILERLKAEATAVEYALKRGIALCEERTGDTPRQLPALLETARESIYQSAPHLAPVLDCFNQMGNMTFLRSRAGLTRTPSEPTSKIQSVYGEYFGSVQHALDSIAPALVQLQCSLKDGCN